MALVDFAGGVNNSVQRILARRLMEQQQAQALKQQEFQNQRLMASDARAQQQMEQQSELVRMQRETQAAAQADQAKQRTYAEANALGDQLPPQTFMAENDPAVATMQQGGRGALLTAKDAGMGQDFQGPMPTGETPQSVANNRPRGFLKTASAKQQQDMLERQAQDAKAQADEKYRQDDLEIRRAAANKPQADSFETWKQRYDYERANPKAGAERPDSAEERKAAGFYGQMTQAVKTLDELESQLSERDLYQIQTLPQEELIGAMNRGQMSEPAKRYLQAFEQFTEARLRPVSGAAINDSEYARDRRTYARQYGETPALAAQRKASRQQAIAALRSMGGKAIKDDTPSGSVEYDFVDGKLVPRGVK